MQSASNDTSKEILNFKIFSRLYKKKFDLQRLPETKKHFENLGVEQYIKNECPEPPVYYYHSECKKLWLFALMTIAGIVWTIVSLSNTICGVENWAYIFAYTIPVILFLLIVGIKGIVKGVEAKKYNEKYSSEIARYYKWFEDKKEYRKKYSEILSDYSRKLLTREKDLLSLQKQLEAYKSWDEYMDKIVELLRTSFIYGSCRHIANEYVEFLESITRFMDNDLYEKLERFIINEIEKHGTGTNALMAFHDAYAKAVKKYNDEQQEKKRIQNIIDEEYQLCRGCYNYKSSSGGRCPMAPKRDCAAYIAN